MIFNEILSEKLKPIMESYLKTFLKQFGDVADTINKLSFEFTVRPNHACIYNKVENVGKEATLIATNHKYAVVAFDATLNSVEIYRCQDLTQV